MRMSDPDIRRPPLTAAQRSRRIFLAISVALFVACLFCECFYVDQGERSGGGTGGELLLVGWIGFIDGFHAWFANPLLLIAWIMALLWPRLVSPVFAIGALVLALGFLRHEDILINEGGGRAKIVGYGIGYWLWIASIGTALAGGAVGLGLDVIAGRRLRSAQ
jgi:hypothetical protein